MVVVFFFLDEAVVKQCRSWGPACKEDYKKKPLGRAFKVRLHSRALKVSFVHISVEQTGKNKIK